MVYTEAMNGLHYVQEGMGPALFQTSNLPVLSDRSTQRSSIGEAGICNGKKGALLGIPGPSTVLTEDGGMS